MGRHRAIDREAVLDAAQTVVMRDGAARLTLEAVAAEAKISKASVLYDCKTKQALIKAVIERRVAAERERMDAVMARLGPVSDAAIRARIAIAAGTMSEEDRSVVLSLCAMLTQDADLRKPIQEIVEDRIAQIRETSVHPRGALLAFLAVEGLLSLEWLDFHTWPAAERDALLAEIRWLVDQSPVPAAVDPGLEPH